MDVGNMSDMYFRALSKHYGFSLDTPYRDLPEDIKQILLYGTGDEKIDMEYRSGRFAGSFTKNFEGIVNNLERRYREASSDYVKSEIEKYMTTTPCKTCHGDRLKKEALAVTVGGINIARLCEKSIVNIREFLRSLDLSDTKKIIAERLLKEIDARLSFLINVGLGYLTLSRGAAGLSGGEAQRIRLATQIGSGLTGVLYILDEPSIGLHQRDNDKLIATLERLRDLGNTLIVVEHDVDTMLHSDYLVDVGPGAGVHGGQIVAAGTVPGSHGQPELTYRKISPRRTYDKNARNAPPGDGQIHYRQRSKGKQSQKYHGQIPGGRNHCGYRCVRQRQIQPCQSDFVSRAQQPDNENAPRGRQMRRRRRSGIYRQSNKYRPKPDRSLAEKQSRHLYRRVRIYPRIVCKNARRSVARI